MACMASTPESPVSTSVIVSSSAASPPVSSPGSPGDDNYSGCEVMLEDTNTCIEMVGFPEQVTRPHRFRRHGTYEESGSHQDLPDLVVSQEDMFSNSYMHDAFLTPSEVEVPFQQDDIERTSSWDESCPEGGMRSPSLSPSNLRYPDSPSTPSTSPRFLAGGTGSAAAEGPSPRQVLYFTSGKRGSEAAAGFPLGILKKPKLTAAPVKVIKKPRVPGGNTDPISLEPVVASIAGSNLTPAEVRSRVLQLKPASSTGGFLSQKSGKVLMDLRLAELHLCRHPLQPDTPSDNRCGVWALTPQMSSCRMPGSYGRGNPDIDVHYVDALRTAVVRTLPSVIQAGQLEWILDCTVQEWSDKMSQPMEWVDHIFLTLAAKLLKRDIIIVPCFPENGHHGGDFLRFLGGLREGDLASGQDTAAASPPILLATTEENVFCSGHFQAVAVRDELGLECLRQLEPPVPEEALYYLLPVSPSDQTASLEEDLPCAQRTLPEDGELWEFEEVEAMKSARNVLIPVLLEWKRETGLQRTLVTEGSTPVLVQVHKILTNEEDHPSGYLEVHDGEYLTRAQMARGQVHRLVSGLVQVHSVLEVHRTSGSPGSLILERLCVPDPVQPKPLLVSLASRPLRPLLLQAHHLLAPLLPAGPLPAVLQVQQGRGIKEIISSGSIFQHLSVSSEEVRNKLSAEQYKNVVTMVVSGDYVKTESTVVDGNKLTTECESYSARIGGKPKKTYHVNIKLDSRKKNTKSPNCSFDMFRFTCYCKSKVFCIHIATVLMTNF